MPVAEAGFSTRLQPGTVYVVPGGHDAEFAEQGALRLFDRGTKTFAPSLDRLLLSAARIYQRGVLAVILSGMGRDGMKGLVAVHRAGGTVLGQEAQSCVVNGMPQAAEEAGVLEGRYVPAGLGARLKGWCGLPS
jgi:two-component system chemotaxis response regulator CheB